MTNIIEMKVGTQEELNKAGLQLYAADWATKENIEEEFAKRNSIYIRGYNRANCEQTVQDKNNVYLGVLVRTAELKTTNMK